jgi:hypothetical protein
LQEANIFERYLKVGKQIANKGHLKTALAVGIFLFSIFGLFAFSFYAGSVLVIKKFPNHFKLSSSEGIFKFQIFDNKKKEIT